MEVLVKRLMLLPFCLLMTQCGRVGKLDAGKYEVADQEYSSQNYVLERRFGTAGTFEERHVLDRCLMMEMKGAWAQEGGELTLRYAEMRNRATCRDSLPAFARDSAELRIPVRNVEGGSFESFLAASDGKPDKWIRWLKVD
jgi:hypothetical protein